MVTEARPSESSPNGHGPAVETDEPTARTPPAWQPLLENLDELREYATYYLSVQADRLRLLVRKAIVIAIAAVVAGVAGVTLIATAVVLVLANLGAGLGELLGGRVWLGNLIVGFVVLVATAISLAILGYGIVRASRQKTIEKYDSRRATQRRRFGHDVGSRD